MYKYKRNLVIGLILLLLTINIGNSIRGVFFSDIARDGGTFLYFDVTEEIKMDDVKDTINRISGIEIKEIKKLNGEVTIEMAYTEAALIKTIEDALVDQYEDKIYLSAYTRLGKSKRSSAFYWMISITILCFLLSLFMIHKNLKILIKK